MYELFKIAADQFFSDNTLPYKCCKVPVHDRQGNLVETQYKLSSGRQGIYTLNLYHTKSSCLINGKNSHKFTEIHLPAMLKNIEERLVNDKTTTTNVNNAFKNILMSTSKNESKLSENQNESDSHEELRRLNESVQSVRKEKHARRIDQDAKSNVHEILNDFMKSVSSEINELKCEMREYILQTSTQLGEIKDIVCGLKNQHNLCCSDMKNKLKDVTSNSESVKTQMCSLNEGLLKRWQSFSESMKNQMSYITTQQKETEISLNKFMATPTRSYAEISNDSSSNVPEAHSTQNKDQRSSTENSNNSSSVVSEIHNTPNKDQRSNQTVTRQTLIIGDSILKGINKSDLKTDVDVLTCPGKKLRGIQSNLSSEIVSKYKNIIVYAGGNDAASGSAQSTLYNDIKSLILDIRRKSESCAVYLCTVCQRIDTDVLPLNELLKRTGEDLEVRIIDCHQAFVFGNGDTASHYYHRDGIHLNAKGTSALITAIHRHLPITRHGTGNGSGNKHPQIASFPYRSRWQQGKQCTVCGLRNHIAENCYQNRRGAGGYSYYHGRYRNYRGQRQVMAPTMCPI